jgi:predicted phage tail protein
MEGTKRKRSLTLPQNKSGLFRLIAAVVVFALLFWRVGAVATVSQFGADTWLRLAVSGLILGGMYALIAIGYLLMAK